MINHIFQKLSFTFLNPNSLWYFGWILIYFVIGGVFIFVNQFRNHTLSSKAFFSELLPKSFYFSESSRLDYKWFLLMTVFGVFVNGYAFYFTAELLAVRFTKIFKPIQTINFSFGKQVVCTILLLATMDFGYVLFHYLSHKVSFLWRLHKVHHSATVLTPVTNERVHPLERLFEYTFVSVFIFFGSILIILLFGDLPTATSIHGISLSILIFAVLPHMNHLRHSHLWISFGPINWIISSPCMHQIHHSSNPKHHDRNFARLFSIFDLMFGTLYVPSSKETLQFGVMDGSVMEKVSHSFCGNLVGRLIDKPI